MNTSSVKPFFMVLSSIIPAFTACDKQKDNSFMNAGGRF